jgi:hypothetical protein
MGVYSASTGLAAPALVVIVGDYYDNAIMESSWNLVQNEL